MVINILGGQGGSTHLGERGGRGVGKEAFIKIISRFFYRLVINTVGPSVKNQIKGSLIHSQMQFSMGRKFTLWRYVDMT